MINAIVERFAEQAPAAVLFRGLFARVFSEDRLDRIFHVHKGRQFEGELLFSSLLKLLTPVVAGTKSSVHAAFQQSPEGVAVSFQAVYDKLKGVEAAVCAALVAEPADELAALLRGIGAGHPDPVPGYHAFVIDGKRLDATEHRLQEARLTNSAPLPGTVLAMLDTRGGLFTRIECDPDAYACERKVVLPMLDRLKAGALYLADRNFCDGPLIERFVEADARFLLRQHGRSPSWRTIRGQPRRKVGTDGRGGTAYERAVEVRLPEGGWHRCRRVSVCLATPTRDGDTWLHLLTDLPAEVSAVTVADAYRQRWTIETSLGHVSCVLRGEVNTLAYPKAALLCFSLALTLFNILATLKRLLEKFGELREGEELSYFYLAAEIAGAMRGLEIAVEPSFWCGRAAMPPGEFLAWAESVAARANLGHYRKHPRKPKKPPPTRTSGKNRAHMSSHRILQDRKKTP